MKTSCFTLINAIPISAIRLGVSFSSTRALVQLDKGPPTVGCEDAKSAMRDVRAHATELGIDPQRLAAAGGSAGGHLAAFTALVKGFDDPHDDLAISCQTDSSCGRSGRGPCLLCAADFVFLVCGPWSRHDSALRYSIR
ncbi:MAG: alpha/beta hydrolase fold domain-containing protein [bacterium]|nr:alpha/beta hydrolase fold domain-containing protein [bacterium]